MVAMVATATAAVVVKLADVAESACGICGICGISIFVTFLDAGHGEHVWPLETGPVFATEKPKAFPTFPTFTITSVAAKKWKKHV
jgi:hypothetical protein